MADAAGAALTLTALFDVTEHFLPRRLAILSFSDLLRGRFSLFGLLDGLGLLNFLRDGFDLLSQLQRFAYPSPDLLHRLGNPLDRRQAGNAAQPCLAHGPDGTKILPGGSACPPVKSRTE